MGFLMLVICHSGSLSCRMSSRMEMPESWWFALRMSVSGQWEQIDSEYWGGCGRARCFRRGLVAVAISVYASIPAFKLLFSPRSHLKLYLMLHCLATHVCFEPEPTQNLLCSRSVWDLQHTTAFSAQVTNCGERHLSLRHFPMPLYHSRDSYCRLVTSYQGIKEV